MSRRCTSLLLLASLLCLLVLGMATPAQACTTGACVTAGPRAASVDSTRGALLNALLGRLTNSTINVTAADWNAVATGSVSLVKTLDALQLSTTTFTPTDALNANTTIAGVINAAATASGGSNPGLTAALGRISAAFNGSSLPIQLGSVLKTDGALGTTEVNALELISGVVQFYNKSNVLTTPTALTVSGVDLGIASITTLRLSAQVIEAPTIMCGKQGDSFHTASIRLKLSMDLASVALDTGLLADIPLVNTVSLQLVKMDLYIEVASADGVLGVIDAINKTVKLQATPGLVRLYIGTMVDTVFFNRSHTIVPASDLGWATIASLSINGATVSVRIKANAQGTTPTAKPLTFNGPFPETQTASTQLGFLGTLVGTLLSGVQVSITPSLGVLDGAVELVLKTLLQLQLPAVLDNLTTVLLNPLLDLLGVRLGEMDVTVRGTYNVCNLSGCVYNDLNHSGVQESGETGTTTTLYAKLVDSTAPTVATAVATVDPNTGNYSFPNIAAATYSVVINTSASANAVSGASPTGWIATETPSLSRSIVFSKDTTGQNFGLYHGSKLSGSVFNDNGTGGGTAHNQLQEAGEAGILAVPVKALDNASSTVIDSTTTGDRGTYTLWIPYTATTVRVTQPSSLDWASVGGSAGNTGGAYTVATDSTLFSVASGSAYTGVNFADVPVSRFDTDNQQAVAPGNAVFYPHRFTAGTSGQLSFTATPAAVLPGWSATFFTDADCNGKLDSGEAPLTAAVPVVADQRVCVIVKVFAPATATYNQQNALSVVARLALSNHTLTLDHTRNDLSIVGQAGNGLQLTKTVDRTTATTGNVIVYTITYRNAGSVPLSTLKIFDATPAYTVMSAATCGVSPSASLVCTVATKPAAGLTGALGWTFTGALESGASGTVTFSVVLQ